MVGNVASAKVLAVMPDDQLLRVRRRSGEPITGFVSSVGDRWALIHRCHDTTLDGYSAIRLRDITDIVIDPRSTVVARALELKGHEFGWIPAGLDSTAAVLGWCATRFEILTVHPEHRQPSTCHVGIVESVDANAKTFRLRELSPMAQWWADSFSWKFADVTRVDVGDAYANDLLAVNRADVH
ncbi:MAG: hypothetical protein AB7V43_15450 [Acidimicrobiia bacterium]